MSRTQVAREPEEVALLKARLDKTDPPPDRTPTAPVDDTPDS